MSKNNSFTSHFIELRSRLIKTLIFIIFTFIISYTFSEQIYSFLVEPYANAVKDDQKAIEYARQWLVSIDEGDAAISSKECRFCHSQGAPKNVEDAINTDGYFIYKMEGCK